MVSGRGELEVLIRHQEKRKWEAEKQRTLRGHCPEEWPTAHTSA